MSRRKTKVDCNSPVTERRDRGQPLSQTLTVSKAKFLRMFAGYVVASLALKQGESVREPNAGSKDHIGQYQVIVLPSLYVKSLHKSIDKLLLFQLVPNIDTGNLQTSHCFPIGASSSTIGPAHRLK